MYLEDALYRVVENPTQFRDQFEVARSLQLATDNQWQVWDWFCEYVEGMNPHQLQNGLRFFTGSIYIPTPLPLRIQFEDRSANRFQKIASTCSGVITLDESFETKEQMIDLMSHCFVDEQAFGFL